MGHYRSEMVDDTDRWERKQRMRANLERNIERAIDKNGLPWLIAQIVDSLGTNGFANSYRDEPEEFDRRMP